MPSSKLDPVRTTTVRFKVPHPPNRTTHHSARKAAINYREPAPLPHPTELALFRNTYERDMLLLEEENQRLRTELQVISRRKSSHSDAEFSSKERMCRQLEAVIKGYEKTTATLRQDIRQQIDDGVAKSHDVEQKELVIAKQERTIKNVIDARNKLQGRFDKEEAEKVKLEKIVKDLQSQLKVQRKVLAGTRTDLEAETRKGQDFANELFETRTEVAARDKVIHELKKEVTKHKMEARTLKVRLNSLHKSNAEDREALLEAKKCEKQARHGQLGLREEVSKLQGRLVTMKADIKRVRKSTEDQMVLKDEEVAAAMEQTHLLSDQMLELEQADKKRRKELLAVNERLHVTVTEVSRLQNETKAFQERVEHLTKDMLAAREQEIRLNSQLDDATSTATRNQSEIKRLQDGLVSVKGELVQAKDELTHAREDVKAAEQSLRDSITMFEKKLSEKTQMADDEKKGAEEARQKLEDVRASAEAAVKAKADALEQLESEYANAKEWITELETDLDQAKASLSESESKNNELQAVLTEMAVVRADLDEQIDDLTDQVTVLTETQQVLNEELDNTREREKQAKSERDVLAEEREGMEDEHTRLRFACDDLRQQLKKVSSTTPIVETSAPEEPDNEVNDSDVFAADQCMATLGGKHEYADAFCINCLDEQPSMEQPQDEEDDMFDDQCMATMGGKHEFIDGICHSCFEEECTSSTNVQVEDAVRLLDVEPADNDSDYCDGRIGGPHEFNGDQICTHCLQTRQELNYVE